MLVSAILGLLPFSPYAEDAGLATRVSSRSSNESPVRLRVMFEDLPKLPGELYVTRGKLVQLKGKGRDLRRANRAIRDGITTDQKKFIHETRQAHGASRPAKRGVYLVAPDRRLMSASSRIFSALLPSIHRPPGNQHGKDWIGITIAVPGGDALRLSDVFVTTSSNLKSLIALASEQLRRSDAAYWSFCGPKKWPSFFRPTDRGLADFALLRDGVAFGFAQPPACTRSNVIIRYSELRPLMTELGKLAARQVRDPL